MPNTSHILILADEWLRATGLRETILSYRLFEESKKLTLLRAGGDLTLARYRLAVLWFSENWPVDATWPQGVARPMEAA